MEFKLFSDAVRKQYTSMSDKGQLFRADVSKSDMWQTYLLSFPEGTNPVFRERTEHDCNCCRGFINNAGNAVYINDSNELESIWDIELDGYYGVVAKAMSELIKTAKIRNVFKHFEQTMGVESNKDTDSEIIWNHFHAQTFAKNYCVKGSIDSKMGDFQGNFGVLKRGLTEIKVEAVDTVLELIAQDSLYRGAEHLKTLKLLKKHLIATKRLRSDKLDLYCWKVSVALGRASRVRNSVIGTLVVDLSDGVDLSDAVKAFESKVAPLNYKRTTALVTPTMIANAQKLAVELGIVDSLSRRYAVAEDLTINNVLFADSAIRPAMNAFEKLTAKSTEPVKNYDKVESIGIDKFIADVLPKADSLELMFENKHSANCVSLIAPQNADAKPIFKWGNNFSWAYAGDVTDSIKERIKKAGGSITGDLRCSLAWFNYDDLDIHVKEPNGGLISYSRKHSQYSDGYLDVDMNAGGGGSRNAVENIVFTDKKRMQEGQYEVIVHNYAKRESIDVGCTIEIEFCGTITTFNYPLAIPDRKKISVATFNYSHRKGVEFIKTIPSTEVSKDICGVQTGKFQKVNMVMCSPNHWDGNQIGNLHHFFMLDGFINEDTPRGFFNEFLMGEFTEHRKVFEALGAQMRVEHSDEQLSGLGFSATSRNEVLCRVQGAFSRVVKIKF